MDNQSSRPYLRRSEVVESDVGETFSAFKNKADMKPSLLDRMSQSLERGGDLDSQFVCKRVGVEILIRKKNHVIYDQCNMHHVKAAAAV